VSLADAPSVQIARKEMYLNDLWRFPLAYTIEVDEAGILDGGNWRKIAISARIHKHSADGGLKFISDMLNEIVDWERVVVKSRIDLNMIRVGG